jgi:hypothetical protein
MNSGLRHPLRRWVTLRWPRGVAIAFCGLMGTLLPAAYGTVKGIPAPKIHDEFSYLLAADTFAHGRLTNPSPPLPEFFEAEHILVVPSYCSKYPPAQGLVLALGQVLFGRPIWGVWLSCGLFAAALCWMLQAWSSGPWAIATTALTIGTFGVTSYWAQSYWGGMVAACGGALLFGSLRRTLRTPRVRPSILMGAGVLLLANTRPFEGMLGCAAAAAPLAVWLARSRGSSMSAKLTRWLLPFSGVLLIGATWMTYYNHAVTGGWLVYPYALHQNQYFYQGVFRFSAPRQPDRMPVPRLAAFYANEKRTAQHGSQLALATLEAFYAGLPMTVDLEIPNGVEPSPLAALWLLALIVTISLQDCWVWFCVGTVSLVMLGVAMTWWAYPHYLAPVYPLEFAVVSMTLRRADAGSHALQGARRMTPLLVVVLASLFVLVPRLHGFVRSAHAVPRIERPAASGSPTRTLPPFMDARESIERQLERQGGRHLVFVHYDPDFTQTREMVYNGADLTGSPVIFAHDLGTAKNTQLIAVYPDRTLWMLHVSTNAMQLAPYR